MIVDFQLTINGGEISESDSVNGRTLNTAPTGLWGNFTVVYGFRHYFDNYQRREEHYNSGWGQEEETAWGYSSDFPTEPKIDQLKSMKGKMIFKFETKPTFQKEFIQRLGLNLVAPEERENFTIICQDQKIKFEKQLLINISPR